MSGWSPSTSAEDPSGGALFIILMLLVLDVTVDQCANGDVTAEMQKQRNARTRRGKEGREGFSSSARTALRWSVPSNHLVGLAVERRGSARRSGQEMRGQKRPSCWPKDSSAICVARGQKTTRNTQRGSAGMVEACLAWPEYAALPIGQKASTRGSQAAQTLACLASQGAPGHSVRPTLVQFTRPSNETAGRCHWLATVASARITHLLSTDSARVQVLASVFWT